MTTPALANPTNNNNLSGIIIIFARHFTLKGDRQFMASVNCPRTCSLHCVVRVNVLGDILRAGLDCPCGQY